MKIYIKQDYGPVLAGEQYTLVAEGHDWILIKCKGKNLYLPSKFEGRPKAEKGSRPKDEDDYEEYLQDYMG